VADSAAGAAAVFGRVDPGHHAGAAPLRRRRWIKWSASMGRSTPADPARGITAHRSGAAGLPRAFDVAPQHL